MVKPLPVGISDYKNIIDGNYYYVDKTLLIKELAEVGGGVTLLCRPRRFGKTLNLSMLRYFFEKSETDTSYLFKDKAIWQHETYHKLQGHYPVIYVTFKDVKDKSWKKAHAKIVALIATEYKRHQNFIETNKHLINKNDYQIFQKIAKKQGTEEELNSSLHFLCKLLSSITNNQVVLLIDEYDSPIHAGYNNNYYDAIIECMRDLLSSALKDNIYLERAVLTGILRTAKESIFSGLNNLAVRTLLHNTFADKFGFTAQEVDALVADRGMSSESETIKQWYNGYRAGNETLLLNPWSVLECMQNGGALRPYWTNTSDNVLIKKLIEQSSEDEKKDLEQLLTGTPFTGLIDEAFAFSDIENGSDVLWSLLLFSGYITYSSCESFEDQYRCSLIIPNSEIRILYKKLLRLTFKQAFKGEVGKHLLNALQSGDVERLSELFKKFVVNSMSFFDFAADEPERSYHLFVLGMLVLFNDVYQVRSNRESGYGRYDIMMIPHDKTKNGVILEFKKATSGTIDVLEKNATEALAQVKEKKYVQELHAQHIDTIFVYGIAFYGKKVCIKMESFGLTVV